MKKMEFSIILAASPEKVWDVITGKETYEQWTKPFSEGSTVETDWKKGSKALFLDGSGNGMVSKIVESIPGKRLSIRHLGEVKQGVEDPTTYQTPEWGDAIEDYSFKTVEGNKTLWVIHLDMVDQWVEFMEKTWPLAMAKVKELAEN